MTALSQIVIFISLFACAQLTCPDISPLEPCTCRTMVENSADFSILRCHNLDSEDSLMTVIEATKQFPLYELELVDCDFEFLPYDAFVNTSYQILSLKNSSLISLSNSDIAFDGLSEDLHLLEIINCTFASHWNWDQLKHLENLIEMQISDTNLDDIVQGLHRIKHLNLGSFMFQNDGITQLDDLAFYEFPYLTRVGLDRNRITELKRSMFPEPAHFLKILGLSYNLLDNLPRDLFSNMPALKSLYLTGNPLHTINEEIYRPIWDQLHLFLFSDTLLSCDCRLQWLVRENNKEKSIYGECMRPKSFKGRGLHSIMPHELWC